MEYQNDYSQAPESKRPRLDEQALEEHASAMKVAGFSLSAIEEMKTRVEDEHENMDEQLRQFQVLDEVHGSGTDDSDGGSENGEVKNDRGHDHDHLNDDRSDDGDDDSTDLDCMDVDELENLLDENLPENLRGPKKKQYEERYKTVLEEKGHNHFEVLPEDWVKVTHNSGMPLYLHKKTRVCSASRPYFLGAGSVRKHDIPLDAIPCLNYRQALAEEQQDMQNKQQQQQQQQLEKQQQLEPQILPTASNSMDSENGMTTTSPTMSKAAVEMSNNTCPYDGLNQTSNSNMENLGGQLSQVGFATTTNGEIIAASSGEAEATSTAQIMPLSSSSTTSTANSTATTATAAATTTTTTNVAAAVSKTSAAVPAAKIVTVDENTQKQSLTAEQLNLYCKKLFKFKTIRVLRFRSWNARRKFTKNRKHIKNLQRPTLPDGTKLIKFPILTASGDANTNPRGRQEWIMNPNGKSYVCILHEYVQHTLKKQPTYKFKELENAATPYLATVSINDIIYGTGYGTSKKQAKSDAARETLEILIPQMKDKITGIKTDKTAAKNNQKDLSVFDDIRIEDPRVTEFCNKTTEPPPHAILLTCLQRNFGLGEMQINYEINRTKNKKNEFTMTVGKHQAKLLCKNKREGKQLASQAILQILHPHIKTWGSLLRLYGNNSIKTFKEKKIEEQEITVLQSKAAINQPNYAILDKLKSEMLKLSEKNMSVQTFGTFVPPNDVDLPTSSGSNLKNLDL